MSADFTPNMESYRNPHYFRFWCQKVLPLVYDDSLSYYELLCKVVNYLNDVIADSDAMKTNIGNLLVAYNELQDYVNHYFDNLDVQEEINNKLDEMSDQGVLADIIAQYLGDTVQPIFVSSVDQMTDHNNAYVLSSTGEIYYYNGDSFIPSGIRYGSGAGAVSCFNHLLTPSGAAELDFDSFDNCEKNKIYAYAGNPEEYITGLPDHRYNGILIDFAYSQASDAGRLQIFANQYQSWFRVNWNNAWLGWYSNAPSSEIFITSENAASYPDIRTLPTNNCYAISSGVTSEMVANLPKYGSNGVLYKVNMDSNEASAYSAEILLYATYEHLYYQIHFGNTYSAWNTLETLFPYVIGANNEWYGYTSYDDFGSGDFIISDANGHLLNKPAPSMAGVLISRATDVAGFQIFYMRGSAASNNRVFIRSKWSNAWTEWHNGDFNGYNIWGNAAVASNGLSNDLNTYYDKYILAISANVTKDGLKNLPIYGVAGFLFTASYSAVVKNASLQIYAANNNTVWFRLGYQENTWYDWVGVGETGYNYFINTCIDKPIGLDSNSKILTFGDSITAGYPVGAAKAWPALVGSKIGCSVENKAVSQAMFNEEDTRPIIDQVNGVTDWNTITHVFVAGGVNDASTGTDLTLFRTYVQNVITAIRANTNVPIIFITPIERVNAQRSTVHYSSIINTVATANDCSVINGYDIPIPFKSTEYYDSLTTDGLHPNEQGQKVYARYVLSCIL